MTDEQIPLITRAVRREHHGRTLFDLYHGDQLIGWTVGVPTVPNTPSCHEYGSGRYLEIELAPTFTITD